ncbi:hypothetical protein JHK87_009974 [Glycine soja]|nr:hypothetical protein JHK87_009974 [Glycine soja]
MPSVNGKVALGKLMMDRDTLGCSGQREAKDSPLQPITFQMHVMEHPWSMFTWINRYNYNYTVEEEDTVFKVYEDVGDFIDDKDLTPSDITFYQGVYDEEISREKLVSSNKEWDSSGDNSDPSEDMTSP